MAPLRYPDFHRPLVPVVQTIDAVTIAIRPQAGPGVYRRVHNTIPEALRCSSLALRSGIAMLVKGGASVQGKATEKVSVTNAPGGLARARVGTSLVFSGRRLLRPRQR
jgi:hypothetical protein